MRIVENMRTRPSLLGKLHLNVWDAEERLEPAALQLSAEKHNVEACLLLPSTGPLRIQAENDRFVGFTREFSHLRTLATLHPMMKDPLHEMERMFDLGIPGFKFSSFSQKFDPSASETGAMLKQLERLSGKQSRRPVAVFDTFVRADSFFGADPSLLTTPLRLSRTAKHHPGILFVAAHMGGLLADFDEILRDLPPAENLYLDTSNAAHTLTEDQFVQLLSIHGPSHILFGTDWPWFVHSAEPNKVDALLIKAGYDESERNSVFSENARRIFGF